MLSDIFGFCTFYIPHTLALIHAHAHAHTHSTAIVMAPSDRRGTHASSAAQLCMLPLSHMKVCAHVVSDITIVFETTTVCQCFF
jgi:hypothetical protein